VLRITTGTAKNKRLLTPEIENFRAVQEIAKGAIFAILENRVAGAKVLDLFAGSGNLGLEALSRGAKHCDFVDEHPKSARVIQENIKQCGFSTAEPGSPLDDVSQAAVTRKNALKFVENSYSKGKTYDIVFLDPFYEDTAQIHLFKFLPRVVSKTGVIIYLYGENVKLDKLVDGTNLEVVTTRRFGRSYFSVLSPKA
jgi:16S rRNA (guanine966-N2)-methyltransferase